MFTGRTRSEWNAVVQLKTCNPGSRMYTTAIDIADDYTITCTRACSCSHVHIAINDTAHISCSCTYTGSGRSNSVWLLSREQFRVSENCKRRTSAIQDRRIETDCQSAIRQFECLSSCLK